MSLDNFINPQTLASLILGLLLGSLSAVLICLHEAPASSGSGDQVPLTGDRQTDHLRQTYAKMADLLLSLNDDEREACIAQLYSDHERQRDYSAKLKAGLDQLRDELRARKATAAKEAAEVKAGEPST